MADKKLLVEELFDQLTGCGVDWDRFNVTDLNLVENFTKSLDHIIWINNGIRGNCHFINDAGRDYYFGIKKNYLTDMGPKVYSLMMHPDHFDDFHRAVLHWDKFPKKIYNTTFRVKTKAGQWRWTHSSSKALNFSKAGKPEYILSIVHDIESIIHFNSFSQKEGFLTKNAGLYMSLTKRELEIIRLIALEKTTIEIADELSISKATVDTHRKNAIRKLGVRTSLGLVRFHLLFEGLA